VNAQLPLPIVLDRDPRLQLTAARKLARIVRQTRNSYECRRFRERRAAMIKHTRGVCA